MKISFKIEGGIYLQTKMREFLLIKHMLQEVLNRKASWPKRTMATPQKQEVRTELRCATPPVV